MISEFRFKEIINNFSDLKPIIVLGDVGIDKYTFGEVKRISPEAPVPVLEVQKQWMKLGLAANVSDNLNAMSVASTLFGVVGEDSHADTFENLMEDNNLTTWGILRSPTRLTTFKERITTGAQQICRVDYETHLKLDEDTSQRLIARLIEFSTKHSAIIIEDYGKGLFSAQNSEKIIRVFKDLGKLVCVDPSRISPAHWYKGVDLLKPNLAEAQAMVSFLGYNDLKDPSQLAEVLLDKLELQKVVITLGAKGMGLLDRKIGKYQNIPTFAREVFDVSGAGDTAIAALCACLVSGATLEEAAWVANCASGVVVGKRGTATVDLIELLDFYRAMTAKNSNKNSK